MDDEKLQALSDLKEAATVATTVQIAFPPVGDEEPKPPVERTFKRDILHVLKPGLYVMSGQYSTDENDKYANIEIMSAHRLGSMKFDVAK